MTCIIGLKHHNKIYLGGDSAASNSAGDIDRVASPKIFTRNGFTIGYTGSFRMGQILQYGAALDSFTAEELMLEPMDFMVNVFVERIRVELQAKGHSQIDKNRHMGGTFLVAYRDDLYEIQTGFDVLTSIEDFHAVGNGDELAIGSLATSTIYENPCVRIRQALEIASRFKLGVTPPFHIIEHPANLN